MRLGLLVVFLVAGCGATRPVSSDAGKVAAVDAGAVSADTGPGGLDAGANRDPLKICNAAVDCRLIQTSCCGHCGEPTLADAQGVNERQTQAMRERLCGDEDVDCPECEGFPYPGHFIAACVAGQCTALDVHAGNQVDDRCETDGDCRVRSNTCCGNCGVADDEFNSLAVSVEGRQEIETLLCGGMVCEACGAPDVPSEVEAYCDEANRCRLRRVP